MRQVASFVLSAALLSVSAASITEPAPAQAQRPDLVVTAVSDPPGEAAPGDSFQVTDTVENHGAATARDSTTRYYLSVDSGRSRGDRLLGGSRAVPKLAPGEVSTGPASVTIPLTVLPGVFFLLACADDTNVVSETHEMNNCRTSVTTVQIARPDLVLTAVSDPPVRAARGESFDVTDTVQNQGLVATGPSITRYYFSIDPVKSPTDKPLAGSRAVPSLRRREASTATVTVTIPPTVPPGMYFLLICADDTQVVPEGNETNNCRAASRVITVAR